MKYINSFKEHLNENHLIPYLNNSILSDRKIEGRFLNKKDAALLQKEIEDNYIDGDMMQHFRREKDDIRMKLFNYDHPIAQKTVNGIDVRIAEGLIRNKRKTYLVYIDGKIRGEFYSVQDIKDVIDYIEKHLIKDLPV